MRGETGLLPILRLYTWGLPAIILLGVLASLAEGLGIGLFLPFLHSLDATPEPTGAGNWLGDTLTKLFQSVPEGSRLAIIASCIFGSVLLKAFLTYSNNLLLDWLDAHIAHRLRRGVLRQVLTMPFDVFERSESGRYLNILANETWRTSEALRVLVRLITTLTTVAVYAALLLLMSWKLTLVAAVAMVLIAVVVRRITRSAQHVGDKIAETNAQLASRMVDSVDGMNVIRSFGREAYEQDRFDRASSRLSRAMIRQGLLQGTINPVYEILAAALLVAILLSSANSLAGVSVLLVFIFVLYRLQPKISELDASRVRLNSLSASVKAVTSLVDLTAERESEPTRLGDRAPLAFAGLDRGIRFENVTFRYTPDDQPALRDVSLDIPSCRTTALVGPSGGGKSTLIKLILRFYGSSQGRILVDGVPIETLELESWRESIALVSQDVFIFDETVRFNIAYGRLEASEEEIVDAARQAAAHDFIMQLPEGYDTRLGYHGMRLSGGQQQRISLARALVRNPGILILDEATNALDSISERWIQEALDLLSRNRTVILIAHRLATIERADQIIVLEDGRVREHGQLRSLLENDGLFAEMYKLQNARALSLDS